MGPSGGVGQGELGPREAATSPVEAQVRAGTGCTASRGSPVVLGPGRRPVLTPLRSRGGGRELLQDDLEARWSPWPLVGRPRGFWTRFRLGIPSVSMECRNRLESRQSKTRALETSGSRCPVGRGSLVCQPDLGKGRSRAPHGTCLCFLQGVAETACGSQLRAALCCPPGAARAVTALLSYCGPDPPCQDYPGSLHLGQGLFWKSWRQNGFAASFFFFFLFFSKLSNCVCLLKSRMLSRYEERRKSLSMATGWLFWQLSENSYMVCGTLHLCPLFKNRHCRNANS